MQRLERRRAFELSLPAIPAGLLASGRLLEPSVAEVMRIDHVIGMLAGGIGLWLVRAVYFRVRRREGLGLGDVKLAAALAREMPGQALAPKQLSARGRSPKHRST